MSLEKSRLAEPLDEMETLVGNQVSLRLCDTDGKNFYLSQQSTNSGTSAEESKEETPKPIKVPITVIFNQHKDPIRQHDVNFDVTAFAKKSKAKDNSGNLYYKVTDPNLVSYRYTTEPTVSTGDHSLIEFEISPEKIGNFMMHVFIGKG